MHGFLPMMEIANNSSRRVDAGPANLGQSDEIQRIDREDPLLQLEREKQEILAEVTHASPRDFEKVRDEYGGKATASATVTQDALRVENMGPARALSQQAVVKEQLKSEVSAKENLDQLKELDKITSELASKNADKNFGDKEATAKQIEQDLKALQAKYNLSDDAMTIVVDRYKSQFEEKSKQVYENLAWYEKAYYNTKDAIGGATSTVWNFAKGISNDLGLTQLATGAYSAVKGVGELALVGPKAAADLYKVATGQISFGEMVDRTKGNLKEAFSDIAQGGQAVVGAVKLIGEVSGISDAVRCVGCALKGDWKGAAMYGTFALLSAGSIAATVVTAGAAGGTVLGVMGLKATVQQGIKVAVKEGFEVCAKELAEKACQKLGAEVLETAAEKAAQQTVKEVGKELGQLSAKELAQLTPEIAQQLTKEIAEKHVQKGVSELTEKVVKEVGSEWAQKAVKNPNQFIKEMTELGVEKKTAKEMQKLIAKGGADKEIQKVLCEGMQAPLEKRFRDGMTKTFEKNLDEGISKLKDKYKLGDDVAEGMKKGGREGLESGIQKGVKEGLEKGWKKVFDELRKKKFDLDLSMNAQQLKFSSGLNSQNNQNFVRGAGSFSVEQTKFAEAGKAVEIRSGLASGALFVAEPEQLTKKNQDEGDKGSTFYSNKAA
jgi:hypothetical protein